jgi:hypothetical protein
MQRHYKLGNRGGKKSALSTGHWGKIRCHRSRSLVKDRGLTLRPSSPSLYTLQKNDVNAQPTGFRSFQIEAYLQKQSVDDIVAAMRRGWQMDSSHKSDSLQIKYHPPTNLLLVSGTPAALAVAERVIDSLNPLTTNKAKPDSTPTPSAPTR